MTHDRCRLVAQIFVLKDQYKAQRRALRIETVVRRRKGAKNVTARFVGFTNLAIFLL